MTIPLKVPSQQVSIAAEEPIQSPDPAQRIHWSQGHRRRNCWAATKSSKSQIRSRRRSRFNNK